MHETSRDFLFLIWKDPVSRRNYTVGKLTRGESYSFEYCEEFEMAKAVGWEPLKAFPEEKVYVSPTLFSAFMSRLPDPKRRDIDSILQKYGLDEFDGYELLKKSTGRLPIDSYEFINPILPEEEAVVCDFFIVGVRHRAGCLGFNCDELPPVAMGEEVVLQPEPENEYDKFAIRVLTKNGAMLGYIPRYYSESVSTRLARSMSYVCTITEVAKGCDCENCLKARLEIPRKQ